MIHSVELNDDELTLILDGLDALVGDDAEDPMDLQTFDLISDLQSKIAAALIEEDPDAPTA